MWTIWRQATGASRIVRGLENRLYDEENLKSWDYFILAWNPKTQVQSSFQIQKRLKERGTQFVLQIQNTTGRKGLNSSGGGFVLTLRKKRKKKKTWTVGMAECWKKFPWEAVDFLSLPVFNKRLYQLLLEMADTDFLPWGFTFLPVLLVLWFPTTFPLTPASKSPTCCFLTE